MSRDSGEDLVGAADEAPLHQARVVEHARHDRDQRSEPQAVAARHEGRHGALLGDGLVVARAEGDRDEQRFAQNKAADMELSQRADRHDQTATKLEAEAEQLLPQLAELEKEERRLREQMLKP